MVIQVSRYLLEEEDHYSQSVSHWREVAQDFQNSLVQIRALIELNGQGNLSFALDLFSLQQPVAL